MTLIPVICISMFCEHKARTIPPASVGLAKARPNQYVVDINKLGQQT